MSNILDFLRTDTFLIAMLAISILSIILLVFNYLKLNKIKREYSEFMKKLGSGKNIDEDLKAYIGRVEKVENLNKEIIQYCERLDKTVDACIQKVGMVRYNAFKDVGSNLSFTLALLDNNCGTKFIPLLFSGKISLNSFFTIVHILFIFITNPFII